MSLLSRFVSWYRAVAHRSAVAADVEEELRFHIQAHADSLVASGLSPQEAMRQAKAAAASGGTQEERYISGVGLRPFHEISGDVRYGLRSLIRTPMVSMVAVLSLALGIGATVTVFSVIYDAMLHPYPYDHPERIVQVRVLYPGLRGGGGQFGLVQPLSGPQIHALRAVAGVQDVVAMQPVNLTITGSDIPEAPNVNRVTANSFQFLGIPALLGRTIVPADAPDGQDPQPVAVISYKFWQRHYSGDPEIVGKSVQLDHIDYRIVGVIQPRYRWGDHDIFLPLKLQPGVSNTFLVKIKPDTNIAALTARLTPLYEQFRKETPRLFPETLKLHVTNIMEGYAFQLSSMLYLLFGAVVLLLLIACANVSILLLARGSARRHELAIRTALGASRYRVTRQLLVESLLLSVTGTALGVLITYGAIGLVGTAMPQNFAPEAEFQINLPILLFSVALSLVTGLFFGIFPALSLGKAQPQSAMQAGSVRLVGEVHGKHTHNILIAGQIALTVLLLMSAAAAVSGFTRMMNSPLGFNAQNVLALPVVLPRNVDASFEQRIAYARKVRDSLLQVAGVSSVSLSNYAAPPNAGGRTNVEVLGMPSSRRETVRISFVDTQYFRTLEIPLVRGRVWNEPEIDRSATLVLVNQAFLRDHFTDTDPVGRSVRLPDLTSHPPSTLAAPGSDGWLQIIGVVADSTNAGMGEPVEPAVYLPYTLYVPRVVQPLVRTQLPALALLPVIRKQLATVNPDQALPKNTFDLETMIQMQPEWRRGRLISVLFSVFASIALSLAAVGLYSVAGYRVAQRMPEFGIRMTFGARRGHVLRLALLSSSASLFLGLLAGAALTWALRKPLAVWVPEFGANHGILAGISMLMLTVVFLAIFIPSLRVTTVDPMKILRHE